MKFALINGQKVEASKGAKGNCIVCDSEVIAKCGEVKINHWAHKGVRNCDSWWEPETEWHRSWKNNFPLQWQEIILPDPLTGEKHIADVRTGAGLVIEFQHSAINPNERIAREKFYKNMIWVVDGTRLKRDYPRFLKGKADFRNTNNPRIFLAFFLEECFPLAWIGSTAPVIFDFKGTETINDPGDPRNWLYCLLPKKGKYDVLMEMSRQSFIQTTTSGEWLSVFNNDADKPAQNQQIQQTQVIRNSGVRRTSPYILVKGRFVKRRRF